MKKLLALLLVLVMVFSFAACGRDNDSPDEDDIRGEQIDNNESKDKTSSEVEFSLGTTTGLTYESKFIGIGCKLDSDWAFYSDEKIKELNSVTTEIAGEEYAEMMKNATVVYDMFAAQSDQLANVNVVMEKVDKDTLKALDVAENFNKTIPSLKESFENMGYSGLTYEVGTVKIDGKEFACLNTNAEIYGTKMVQKAIGIKCNGYLATVTVTAFGDNDANDIINKFYLVK